MTAKKKTFKALTSYLQRDRSDSAYFSELVRRLPVTVTIRRGRITRVSDGLASCSKGKGTT